MIIKFLKNIVICLFLLNSFYTSAQPASSSDDSTTTLEGTDSPTVPVLNDVCFYSLLLLGIGIGFFNVRKKIRY